MRVIGKNKKSKGKKDRTGKDHQTTDDHQLHQNDQTTSTTVTTASSTTTTTSENNNDTPSGKDAVGMSQLTTPDSPIIDLKQSCNSPIMSGNYPNRRRTTPRKTGVAERNETERKVVYKTLKNYNQINKLHDYDLV